MVQIDAWQEFGFDGSRRTYLSRLAPEKGVRRDIDDNGDLLVRRVGKPEPSGSRWSPRSPRRRGSIRRRGGPRA